MPLHDNAPRIEAAAKLVKAGRLEQAEAMLQSVLKEEPGHPDALNTLATLALAAGKPDQAFEILSGAATAHPRHDWLVANLGLIHSLQQRPAEALACLKRAVALAPEKPTHRLSLAQLHLAANDPDAAGAALQPVLERDPGHAGALAERALIRLAQNDLTDAESDFRAAIAADPDAVEPRLNLARLLLRLGQAGEAMTVAEEASLVDPLDLNAQVLFARIALSAGETDRAESTIRGVLAVAPQHGEAIEAQAMIEFQQGHGHAAVNRLSAYVRAQPRDATGLIALARMLRLQGRFEHALKVLDQLPPDAPTSLAAESLRADLLLILGRYGEVWPARIAGESSGRVGVPPGLSTGEAVLLARFLKHHRAEGGVTLISPGQSAALDVLRLADGVAGAIIEPIGEADPLLPSLPAAVPLDGDRIAAGIPYLKPDKAERSRWLKALAALPRPWIGVAWASTAGVSAAGSGAAGVGAAGVGVAGDGSVEARVPLLREAVAGIGTAIALAVDPQRADLASWPEAIDAGRHFERPSDLVAAISCLDLVLAPDSLPLHLAGALGISGIGLVGPSAPWYFSEPEQRSRWYPSLTLLRLSPAASEPPLALIRSALDRHRPDLDTLSRYGDESDVATSGA